MDKCLIPSKRTKKTKINISSKFNLVNRRVLLRVMYRRKDELKTAASLKVHDRLGDSSLKLKCYSLPHNSQGD